MKNIKQLLSKAMVIFIIILFTFSCVSPSLRIVKRQYSQGFYENFAFHRKERNRAVDSKIKENSLTDSMTVSNDGAKVESEIINNEPDSNLTASISNEITIIKNETQSNVNTLKKINTTDNLTSKFPVVKERMKKFIKNPGNGPLSDHDTLAKILKIGGIVIAIIGVLIYLSAYPSQAVGMTIGRLLLASGIVSWFIGTLLL